MTAVLLDCLQLRLTRILSMLGDVCAKSKDEHHVCTSCSQSVSGALVLTRCDTKLTIKIARQERQPAFLSPIEAYKQS